MLNLTRQQTALLEFGRKLDNWKLLNGYAPDNSTCEGIYTSVDDDYQETENAVESAINQSEEVWGIDENLDPIEIFAFPGKKAPGTRPSF